MGARVIQGYGSRAWRVTTTKLLHLYMMLLRVVRGLGRTTGNRG